MTNALEQFELIPVFFLPCLKGWLLPFSNGALVMLLGIIIFIYFVKVLILQNATIIPNRYQYVIEFIYEMVYDLVRKNVGIWWKSYVPIVFSVFSFLLICNMIGVVPYGFTVTSHIMFTCIFSLFIFLGVVYLALIKHGVKSLKLFLPSGSTFYLAPLLVPIEFISFIFRLISLAVRLFANMLAGHTLLKVIIGFAWSAVTVLGWTLSTSVIMLILGFILVGFEAAVALIQTYVFTVLICLYLDNSIHLH